MLRDEQTGFAPIIGAAPVPRRTHILGRCLGAYLVSACCYLSVPIALQLAAGPDPAANLFGLALFRTAVNDTAADQGKRWQEICGIDDIPEQAGIGARLGRKPIALFRFGKTVYALDDREPGSSANVLSRGILGDAAGEPVVISPLYKQRIRLRDGCQVENGEPAVRAWPVKIENGKVWVGNDALVMRAEAS